jgi:hypothetical protein
MHNNIYGKHLDYSNMRVFYLLFTWVCGGHVGFTGIQLEDCSDQTAQWIDFKFADNVDHTQI